jgi:hypothetical protein
MLLKSPTDINRIPVFFSSLEKAYEKSSKQAKDAWFRFSSNPDVWAPTLGASECWRLMK